MSTINDLKAKSLRALGYTGSIDDMYRSYLRAISGSSLNSVDDLEKLVLGGSGSINDRWKTHLDISGIRGRAMDNMLREYWSTLGAGALGTSYLFRNNEVGVWYDPSDLSTLFQDSAGTAPVTAVGQAVGLMLDKSKGLVLGPESVTNGDFIVGTGWALTSATISGGLLLGATPAAATTIASQTQAQTEGKTYKITVVVAEAISGTFSVYVRGVSTGNIGTAGTHTFYVVAGASLTTYIRTGATGFTGSIDSVSVRELPGYHATQVTSTARPVLQQDANGKYYLAFDGTDDFLVTSAINFTATDKMSVFAGVRKLSDAAQGIVVELSANSTDLANVGSFELSAPSSAAGNDYQTYMRGTSGRSYLRPATFASPITNVVSCVYDLSAASLSTSMYPRINGNLEQDGGAYVAMGGSFGSYALHIGRRGGISLPFNGHLYSLVVRGALSDAAQIAAAEAYVNSKTAAY